MNGDQRDYWKEKYEHEVLGKPKPKEITLPASALMTKNQVIKEMLQIVKKKFDKS